MSAAFWLREQAAIFDGTADRLTGDIEEAEARIVDLRRRRDDARFHRAECLAAANVLDGIGFEVRGAAGSVTVKIDALATVDTIQPDDEVGEP